jgi:hypothetical protein
MRSKRFLVVALMIIAAVISTTSSGARADTSYFFSGQMCQGDTGASADVQYTSNGARNSSTSSDREVWCPIGGHNSTTVYLEGLGLYTYDGRTDAQVTCTLQIRDSSGGYHTSATKGSSVSLTGYRVISWTGSDLPDSGASISAVNTYAYNCTLPADTSAASFLRAYYVQQVSP